MGNIQTLQILENTQHTYVNINKATTSVNNNIEKGFDTTVNNFRVLMNELGEHHQNLELDIYNNFKSLGDVLGGNQQIILDNDYNNFDSVIEGVKVLNENLQKMQDFNYRAF